MQYLYRRGAVYHFYRRIPEKLVPHYGKRHLRHSLGTTDVHEAKQLRNIELVRTDKEFKALLVGQSLPTLSVTGSAMLAAELNQLWQSSDFTYKTNNLGYDTGAETGQIPKETLKEAYHRHRSNTTEGVYTLSQLIDEHRREHSSKLAKAATIAEYESIYELLLSILPPDTVLTDINRQQARRIKDILEYLTPNYKKLKATKGKAPETVADTVKAFGLPLPKPATVNKKLTFVNAIFNYAADEEKIQTNPFKRLSVRDTEKAKDKRQPFTEGELKALVDALEIGTLDYWATLMALHQGMRMGELLQLKCRDVTERSNIWTIRIHTDDDDNTVKTEASCRTVPIHQELIDRGLLRLTDGKSPESLLFPFVSKSADGTYSSWYTKIYSRLLKRIGIHAKYKKTFHSFRHNFRDACRDGEVPTEVINLLAHVCHTY